MPEETKTAMSQAYEMLLAGFFGYSEFCALMDMAEIRGYRKAEDDAAEHA